MPLVLRNLTSMRAIVKEAAGSTAEPSLHQSTGEKCWQFHSSHDYCLSKADVLVLCEYELSRKQAGEQAKRRQSPLTSKVKTSYEP